ncbi:MAG: ATP-binding cassette domain-containing protein [Treponema sp.]|nr:ATP-binding cassette domain-containing protein [Treponema sp.]
MIICQSVEYTYRSGLRALEDINLRVAEGEFVAIVGHNGSGKSTLARVLSGMDMPTKGSVLVNGINTRDGSKTLELRKNLGVVFQNPENQIVFEKVRDDIAFGLKNLGLDGKEIQERITEITQTLKIEYFEDAFELSMGQKQRVAIAGVLAMKPGYIIFDEPTAMLDPQGKKDIHRIIVDLHKQGLTILYVTNVIDEVLSADRIVILNRGKIECEFKREELLDNVDKLKSLALETPFVLDVACRLKSRGLDIRVKDYTIDELVDEIGRAFSRPGRPE